MASHNKPLREKIARRFSKEQKLLTFLIILEIAHICFSIWGK